MNRNIYSDLLSWKHSPRRKPLILKGARQVGKTYALQHFGQQHYKNVAYFNFEKDERLHSVFQTNLDPKFIIQQLSIYAEFEIQPENTLIIFDEVQECPRALNSLKYFCEEANEYHLAGAGSLLGVKTANEKGFPVGKVNFLHIYPLSFFEFLTATDHQKLRTFLEELKTFEPVPLALHEKLLELLNTYLFIGGMPEVVASFVKGSSFLQVRENQKEILEAYESDFAKHAPKNQVMKITVVWKQIHKQLAKENRKFIFSLIRKSARGRDYEEAIQWLLDAGIVLKCENTEIPKYPLSSYAHENIFKLYFIDVGLLGAQSDISPQTLLQRNELFQEMKGALIENFVAQELVASERPNLYYWTSQGTAEIDFIVQNKKSIFPLEVKSGISRQKKSLLAFSNKYENHILSRVSPMNLKENGKIFNYPLYLVSKFPF